MLARVRCGSPYRSAWSPHTETIKATSSHADVRCVYVVLWIGSVVRVALGIMHREPLGEELSLATLAVATLPLVALMKS